MGGIKRGAYIKKWSQRNGKPSYIVRLSVSIVDHSGRRIFIRHVEPSREAVTESSLYDTVNSACNAVLTNGVQRLWREWSGELAISDLERMLIDGDVLEKPKNRSRRKHRSTS
jgi:hypothetical protein